MTILSLGGFVMINIRPVSDLRNKFNELEKEINNTNAPIFLTKNGHGSRF